MTETERSIARTIADFHGEKYISFEHQELAREIFWGFVAPLEESVDYLREEVNYLSCPDA